MNETGEGKSLEHQRQNLDALFDKAEYDKIGRTKGI